MTLLGSVQWATLPVLAMDRQALTGARHFVVAAVKHAGETSERRAVDDNAHPHAKLASAGGRTAGRDVPGNSGLSSAQPCQEETHVTLSRAVPWAVSPVLMAGWQASMDTRPSNTRQAAENYALST